MKTIVVLGATSGIARAFCALSVKRGYRLVLAARNQDKLAALAQDLRARQDGAVAGCLRFDALEISGHNQFFEQLINICPDFDGCLIACGIHYPQEECERDWQKTEDTILTNYAGVVSILNLLMAYFQNRKKGFISCISSVAGDRGRKRNFAYGSTKSALSAYLSGMRSKMQKYDVLVQTIKPGPVDTPMNIGVEQTPFLCSAEKAANAILNALERGQEVVYVPWFWRYIMMAIRCLPEFIFKRLSF